MFQLTLPYALNRDKLKGYLDQYTGRSISLVITDNSTRIVSVKSGKNTVSVRLHWMFLQAGDEIIKEIAGFIGKGTKNTPLISKFIQDNRRCLKAGNRKPYKGHTQGKFFDLKGLFDSLNREYFSGRISASIGWGRRGSPRLVRKRTLGSYCSKSDVIRINPVLDRKNIPLYYIRYVIYHEMLHCDIAGNSGDGRRPVHSSEFKRREKMFREYGKARAWGKTN